MAVKKQRFYKNIPIDSDGEEKFCMWAEECKKAGYIKEYRRGKSYLLSDVLHNNFAIQLKTKSAPKNQVVLFGHSYNLDFEIEWTKRGKELFCNNFGEKWEKFFLCHGNISYIEMKPVYDFANMTRLATLNVKWLWDKHKIFCQIVTDESLFKNTFVPAEALLYKKLKTKQKTFKFPVRSLEDYKKQTLK